jgi:hypothetical protein
VFSQAKTYRTGVIEGILNWNLLHKNLPDLHQPYPSGTWTEPQGKTHSKKTAQINIDIFGSFNWGSPGMAVDPVLKPV